MDNENEESSEEKISDFGQADGSFYIHDDFEQSEGFFTVICVVIILTNYD